MYVHRPVGQFRPALLRGALAAGLLCVLPGCSGDESVEGAGVPAAEDTAGGEPDLGPVAEDAGGGLAPDTAGDKPDLPKIDDIGPSCPAGAGCDCDENKDCDSGFCIDTPAGKKCTKECVDSCDDGFKCAPAGGGGDAISICVPRWGNICNPCKSNGECVSPGNSDSVCVDLGDGGAFCGGACEADGDCPETHACEEVMDVNGKDSKQCLVKGGGPCQCSVQALKAELSTTCQVGSDDAKCSGERKCLPEGAAGAPAGGGLSECLASAPADEVCDATDNDCDGETDEGTCDDDNPCTDDDCGGAKGCAHSNNGADCDADTSVCTVKDVCKDGGCAKGEALDCDDKNACTTDTCDPTEGCQHSDISGAPCNADDNPCTPNDTCKEGACVVDKPKACESGDLCVQGKCDLKSGACVYTSLTDKPCNDGDPCTLQEACDSNDLCQSQTAEKCDDANACTTDSCKSGVGCSHSDHTNPCDDGDKCTTDDACKDGGCVGAAIDVTAVCDDDNVCTKETCSKSLGCKNESLTSTPCDDDNPCTEGDNCAAGSCLSGTNKCACAADKDCASKEDGNKCNGTLICDTSKPPFQCIVNGNTVVKCDTSLSNACQTMACDPKLGQCDLSYKVAGVACDADGDVCSIKDACDGKGKCGKGLQANCDDKNPCTVESCDAKLGCVHSANANACNADDNACTVNDTCKDKVCVPGAAKGCDDKEPCTADACDKVSGQCSHKAIVGKGCDDGNACTKEDTCGSDEGTGLFTCLAGAPNICNDGNPCTDDGCDSKSGCTVKPKGDGVPCNDGDECTASDVCTSAQCKGQAIDVAKSCDDGNACTVDKCETKAGCVSAPKSSGACEDGNPCTNGDTCGAGKCVSGTNICGCGGDADCAKQEDGNLCNGTLYCDKAQVPFICQVKAISVVTCDASLDGFCQKNLCDSKSGKCGLQKKDNNTPCDADKSVCTANDTCQEGLCKAGTPLNCDDGNPCTADSCDAAKGCKKIQQGGPCNADDDACTVSDFCTEGVCKVGKKKTCDDGEDCTADSCDKSDGKCENKNLIKSCSDNNLCTKGDVCGLDSKTSKYTCLSGVAVSCDDGNVCTNDSCGPEAGCKFEIDTKTLHPCYDGPDETDGVGECKPGKAACKDDGKIGVCIGDTKPALLEPCDGKDNNCNKVVDEGCAPTGFSARFGTSAVSGQGAKHGARLFAGGSLAAGIAAASNGSAVDARFGFYPWLRDFLFK